LTPPDHPALAALLGLPAILYGRAVRLRNRLYDRPGLARAAGIPVISVGNLTVGGTGKTPVVAWLARRLLEDGRRPAVVSRGYGGRAGRGPLMVSRGEGPLASAANSGDEPYLLARSEPRLRVVVGSDRHAGAVAAREAGADVILLDDGFQHRRLARDLDIVLLDASNPFGNHRLLPAGLLREPVSGLSRADVVLITRSRSDERFSIIERVVTHYCPGGLLLRAGHRGVGFFDAEGRQVPRPERAAAFCGIGNPNRFRIDLESEGLVLTSFREFRDHRHYSNAEVEGLSAMAARHHVPLITTEKDHVRMVADGQIESLPQLLTYRIEAEIHDCEPLLQRIHETISGAARGTAR